MNAPDPEELIHADRAKVTNAATTNPNVMVLTSISNLAESLGHEDIADLIHASGHPDLQRCDTDEVKHDDRHVH